MSPQQLAGEKPMAADDIYALGATLYELLTTKPPFHRGNPYSLMLQIREKTPLSLVEQRAELEVTGEPIPLAWVRTILACLAKEVGGRPSSAGEALARLGLGPPAGVLAEETGHVPLRTDETIKIEVPPAMAGGTSAVSPAAVLEVAGTRCPSCGKATRETSRHCPHCGADLTEACPECNGRNRAGALYCEECGLDMNALRAVEEAVALAGRQREGENFEGAKETLNRVADAAARLKADGRSGLRQKFDQLCGEVDEAFVAAENHREEAERLRAEAVNSETRGLWKEAAKSWRELADLTGDTAAEASAKRCNARARFEEAKKARDAVATYQAAADWQVVAVPEEKLDDGVWNQLAVQALAQVEEESRKLVAAGRHAELDNAWEPLLQTYVVHDPVRAVEAKARLAERRQEMQATLWAKVAEAERALPLAQRGGRWGEVEETCFRALGFLSALPPEGASAGRTVRQVRDQLQEWRAKATRARVVAQRRNAALAVAILACIGALYYFGMELPRQRAEQVRLERERVAKRRQEKLAEQARLERERSEAERLWIEQRKLRDAGRPWVIPGLNVTMIPIAAGTFTMGSQNGHSDEKPVRQVTLTQRFWLGKTEVPQREWAAVMGGNPSNFKGDSLPVEQVSWTDAMEFCRKLTERERGAGRLPEGYAYTLPTEAQWEYACRAGTTGDYSGRLDEMGWYDKNSGSKTHPVGTKKANAWGLYDMHGNVWEWCADWYGNYAGGSVRDPKGAASGSLRVFRGGGWCNGSVFCRSAIRRWNAPGIRFDYLGFRLALVPQVSQ
ncbi:MAG: hypothetical protein FJ399_13065 [Verrucomicrobia bacterium]|nr:hypothetical protein [Verrucomicrobiota bacterium]